MIHTAECSCGALTLTGAAEPDFVIACNCRACQRRTGSVFGVGAYFRKDAVAITGASTAFARTAESGRGLINHFCPVCGSTVYWTLEMRPDHIGVAAGCVATPLPEPQRAIWTSEKHGWVGFPEHWPTYPFAVPGT